LNVYCFRSENGHLNDSFESRPSAPLLQLPHLLHLLRVTARTFSPQHVINFSPTNIFMTDRRVAIYSRLNFAMCKSSKFGLSHRITACFPLYAEELLNIRSCYVLTHSVSPRQPLLMSSLLSITFLFLSLWFTFILFPFPHLSSPFLPSPHLSSPHLISITYQCVSSALFGSVGHLLGECVRLGIYQNLFRVSVEECVRQCPDYEMKIGEKRTNRTMI
jgi:hypothetical protein